MTESTELKIDHYNFENEIFEKLNSNRFARNQWPVVYILSDDTTRLAYVGETTDTYSRIATHLKHNSKSKLTSVHLISNQKFNKSATLDIESNLIKYMSGDNVFNLLNGNLGLANHNYYQKEEIYWDIFNDIWDQLRAIGITKHSIEHINNSDLFKYSPYKSLTKEQSQGLFQILANLSIGKFKNIIVEGGAGTGKTILAIFLFKMLSTDLEDFSFSEFGAEEQSFIDLINDVKEILPNPKMALVVPMSSFRSTLKKVFKNIKGLSANMVIGPAEVATQKYDLLVIDESHRLRQRVNLGAYFGAFDKACSALDLDKNSCSELDWVLQQSNKTILFYDQNQSIKPSDTEKADFDTLKNLQSTSLLKLRSQFRVKGGNAYVEFIDQLLNVNIEKSSSKYSSKEYELILFDSIADMITEIKSKNAENGLSRLIAGYSWQWKSKKDKLAFDIEIEDVKLKWNATSNDWINSKNSIHEVGCIHTTQGYDLNYSGVIFGNEISYDSDKNEVIIKAENYFDKNGKQSIKDPSQLKAFILNIYKTIMLRGIRGTYVYVCDPELRNYFRKHVQVFKSKTKLSNSLIIIDDIKPFENSVPLYDLKIAAGTFSDQQQSEDFDWVKLPSNVRPSNDLFACQVVGESMNKIIPNGSFCLFRKYEGGSRNGQIVLVENTNFKDSEFGSYYTIKEYESKKIQDENGWNHQTIILKPRSTDPSHEKIILEDDDLMNFKVLGLFVCVIEENE